MRCQTFADDRVSRALLGLLAQRQSIALERKKTQWCIAGSLLLFNVQPCGFHLV